MSIDVREIKDLLRGHSFFEGLDDDVIAFIAGCGTNVRFAAGETIFREGEPADRFFVVRAGKIGIEMQAPGRGALMIDTIDEGDVLGVSWLVPPYRWWFDARALELTRAVSLDAECLRDKCDEDSALGYRLMQRVANVLQRRLQSARVRLLDLYQDASSG